jgi:hypothetical protein
MLKIDLGCGPNKPESFVGVDRFPLPGVDLIGDMNDELPLDSDSVDLLYASHSLEHARDLMHTMREIYRVCKHGAQVCIVAPYYEQKLNLANPYHICVFNEHTPRFWTNDPTAPIDAEEFMHPHARDWGLSMSDHHNPGLDLRLVRMEFFYFPEYRQLSEEKQRQLRRRRIDVCDQIMYHLIVWKPEQASDDRTLEQHIAGLDLFEPDYVKQRKAKELKDIVECRDAAFAASPPQAVIDVVKQEDPQPEGWAALAQENVEIRRRLEASLDTTERLIQTGVALRFAQAEAASHRQNVTALIRQAEELRHTNEELHRQAEELRRQTEELRHTATAAGADLDAAKSQLVLLRIEQEAANGLLSWYRVQEKNWSSDAGDLALSRARLAALEAAAHDHAEKWQLAKLLASDLSRNQSALRSSRVLAALAALGSGSDSFEEVSATFQSLKLFTRRRFRPSARARLQLSEDLATIPYREYRIRAADQYISSISLAVRPLLPNTSGRIGIEIVADDNTIAANITLPLSAVSPDTPTTFILPHLNRSATEGLRLRAFVRDTDGPVMLYEVVQPSILRALLKKNPRRLPFAEFH